MSNLLDDELAREPDYEAGGQPGIEQATLATTWNRVAASIIDSLVLSPVYVLNLYNLFTWKSLPLSLALTAGSILYKPFFEATKSATPGKLAVGIKLVDRHLRDITGDQAARRYIPWAISAGIALLIDLRLFAAPGFEAVTDLYALGELQQSGVLTTAAQIYNIIFLFLVGSLAIDERRQGMHDKWAETYCVKIASVERD